VAVADDDVDDVELAVIKADLEKEYGGSVEVEFPDYAGFVLGGLEIIILHFAVKAARKGASKAWEKFCDKLGEDLADDADSWLKRLIKRKKLQVKVPTDDGACTILWPPGLSSEMEGAAIAALKKLDRSKPGTWSWDNYGRKWELASKPKFTAG